MASGKGGGAVAEQKIKTEPDEELPVKLEHEGSENTKTGKAITLATEDAKETKVKKYKIDSVLSLDVSNEAVIHEDYACMLNQTNIGHNYNKFYIIQVAKDKNNFLCFTRWGRVGKTGQKKTDPMSNVVDAINAFKKIFKDKTKNDWDYRENFLPHPGKYTLIEIDEEDEDEDDGDSGGIKKELVSPQMASMKLDGLEMPLGKLSKTQINKGLETLRDIEEAIKKNEDRPVLMDLSSKFYTLVPHDFGMKAPQVMDTDSIVQTKKEVLEILL